jgi:titin
MTVFGDVTPGANNNVIAGNYIGTDVSGSGELGNGGSGLVVSTANNVIGGATARSRNVISGNDWRGVWLDTPSAVGNLIQNNFIGTDVTGTSALGNLGDGVSVVGASGNTIGGAGTGNLISGNERVGIWIAWGAADNLVAGNLIGTDVTGVLDLGNGLSGVMLDDAPDNIVGAGGDEMPDMDAANTIAFNQMDGVLVSQDHADRNSIRGNSIHSNMELGIDLGDDGVTPNDFQDEDVGANELQNYPVLSRAEPGAETRVVGVLNSTPNTDFVIDVYASAVADPTGHGEGQRWLGSFPAHTDVGGDVFFDVSLPASSEPWELFTTTATDPWGNTSEFSAAATVARIDVQPGSPRSTINVGNNGVIPVAILTTWNLDATTVDTSTVVFAGAHARRSAVEDVNGDGRVDLILHFRTQDTALLQLYTDAVIEDLADDGIVSHRQAVDVSLTGETTHDVVFHGSDSVDLLLSNRKLRDLLDGLSAIPRKAAVA